MNRAVQLASNM